MDKKIIKFDDNKIEEYKFHQYQIPFLMNYIDINKIGVSNKVSFGKVDIKYFIGYKNTKKIRSLCISRQEMGLCRRDINKTK